MSATMTAPATQTQTRTSTGGGGGFRNIIKARTGGGGNNESRFNEARAGSSPAAGVDYKHEKPINDHERDMQAEEAKQHLNAHVVDSVKMQAAIAKEGVRTQFATLQEQRQKTENANLKHMLAQGQGRRIQANIGLTAVQLMGDQIKIQGAQQANQISQAANGLQGSLGQQMLYGMSLQLEATTTQNQNKQELLQFQGLSQGRLAGGGRPMVRQSLMAGRSSLPDISGFGQSGFRRPWAR